MTSQSIKVAGGVVAAISRFTAPLHNRQTVNAESIGIAEKKSVNNARLARALHEGRARLDSLPNFLILDTSSKCNLRCPMCWQTLVSEEDMPRTHLSKKALAEAASIKDYLARINFHGSGEPLLNTDFAEIIAEFRGAVSYMETCTNGTPINQGNAVKLLTAGLNVVRFSCDGDNRSTFERLREGASFERFIENVRLTVALKREVNSWTHLGFNVVVSGQNWRELPGIVALAESLGLDFVAVFAYIEMAPGTDGLSLSAEAANFVRCFLRQYKAAPSSKCYLMITPALDADHSVKDQLPNESTTTKGEVGVGQNRRPCGALYSMMNVKADGKVFPCCIHPRVMGDLNRASVSEIWNGEPYVEMRQQQASGDFDEMCLRCFDGLRYVSTR